MYRVKLPGIHLLWEKRSDKKQKLGKLFVCTVILESAKPYTQGLAKGLGIEEAIQSPTFTIVREYEEGRIPFYHFDVYRIGDIEEMDEIGYEDYVYGDGVCLIEWANLIQEILPDHYMRIEIRKDLEKGFDYRDIEIKEI